MLFLSLYSGSSIYRQKVMMQKNPRRRRMERKRKMLKMKRM
jgi:hypothetical protein